MWKLSIEDDQGNKTVVNLVRDEYTLGRAEDNTVRLTERNISRHHSTLQRNGSGWVISDNQSYNGCFVNGVRVADPQRLEHGDLVQVGDYRLEVTDDAVAAVGSRAATVPAVPKSQMLLGQPDRLVMLVGPTPGAEFALAGGRVVIGRGEECDIAINHSSVSRVHAEIHTVGDGRYELVDRESANGVRLNGVELNRGLIDARDTIELGDVVFKFIPAGVVYRPGADESQQLNVAAVAGFERPAPSVPAPSGMSAGVKAVAAVFGLGLLVVLGMLTLRREPPEPTEPVAAVSSDSAATVLKEAKDLAANGNLEAAHLKLTSGIPEDSNLRQSPEFRTLEAQWADSLFSAAAQETDPAKKREILERITKATSVDSTTRKRAATEIEKLDVAGVAVTDLPPTPTVAQTDVPKPALNGGIVRKDPFATAAPKPAGKPPTASYPKPGPTPAPAPKPVNTSDDLGDRAKLKAMKDSLKGKVASGNASDAEKRMLRALCRQLGDGSCVN
ncbi:MAG: FHA domain-containing protein [Polyangiaceae bacterium]